jgi:hypothetical protein
MRGKKCEQNIVEDNFLKVGNLGNPNIQLFAIATDKYSETFRNIEVTTTSETSSLTKFFKILLGPLDSEDKVTTILRKVGSSLQVDAA